jgi:glycosyltransferase involved in cell wall biosynthesis
MGRWAQAMSHAATYHRHVRVSPRDEVHGTGPHGLTARTDSLKILFIHTATAPPLGADTWVHAEIVANLDPSVHEVHVACAVDGPNGRTPTYEAFQKIPGVRIRPVNLGVEKISRSPMARLRNLAASAPAVLDLIGLAHYIRRNGISIIHTSDRPRDAAAAVVLGRVTRARSIVHAHVAYGEWMSSILRWALRRADERLAISSFVEGTLVASGHDPARTHVALNGIDPIGWTPRAGRSEVRGELGIPETAPVVLTACRLFPEKGPSELIRALVAVRERHPDVRLLVAGREVVRGYTAELADLATVLGVRPNVLLLGHRPDVSRLMAAADVFAMPSLAEPFGLVYLEAMAMELPVVAFDSGGAPEIIISGVTGLLSAPGDLPALAANVSALLSDADARDRMGRAGRARVEHDMTSRRMADDVATVYRSIQRRPAPRRVGGIGNAVVLGA